MKTRDQLLEILTSLISGWEGECVEFKEAGEGHSTPDIGKYFPALSNEANLRDRSSAWLVFGVKNSTRKVVGTSYRPDRERLHNCVAHQDYTKRERILVIERPTELIFQNVGSFFDGTPDDYIRTERTPTHYRNRFLAEAMVHLRMIDTMGFGIREVMWKGQARRYFPLPDFDLTVPGHVILRIQGRFIDENYSRALLVHADMAWPEVLALDTIQKGSLPDDESLLSLRKQGLIEGRKPNLHVTAEIAAATDSEAEYIRHRAFDDRYFCDLILEFLKKFGEGPRSDFERLLEGKFSDLLNDRQKTHKINTLLQRLRKKGVIEPDGRTRGATWRIKTP